MLKVELMSQTPTIPHHYNVNLPYAAVKHIIFNIQMYTTQGMKLNHIHLYI